METKREAEVVAMTTVGGEIKLEYTPTWIVAGVCTVMVLISLIVERVLHFVGKVLKKKNQKPLYEALLKVKEELMLMGFISLMLVAFQGLIQRICIPERITRYMLPCNDDDRAIYNSTVTGGAKRRLLAGGSGNSTYCQNKGKVPLLSLEAINQIHIFIFVIAIVHMVLSLFIMVLGGAKIRQWKRWEEEIKKSGSTNAPAQVITQVNEFEFIKERYLGFGKCSRLMRWSHSFLKQFYGSVTESDYRTLRHGFITTHCRGSPQFNFHKYMVRTLEADYKKVVGLSWYFWIFVLIFLLLNVDGWHIYFSLSFVPLILLLVVGTKLELIITTLAYEVAEKNSAVEGDLVIKPANHHFWFNRPQIILHLVHFILFQNAFEISFFFWILVTYGFNSCIMGRVEFLIPRLVITGMTQLLCGYSTLPLYAIVTQMGSSFKKAIFEEHVQESIIGWVQKVKRKNGASGRGSRGSVGSRGSRSENASPAGTPRSRLQSVVFQDDSSLEEGRREPIEAI